jgi:H+-translocating NAD(P) transhydrogenase subunit beta
MEHFIEIAYIIASGLFIVGLKMMGRVPTARAGNAVSAAGMLLAIVATCLYSGMTFAWIAVALIIGSLLGSWMAYGVKMTQVPEMVGLMNGMGGLASMFVGWAEFEKISQLGWMRYTFETHFDPHFSMAVIYLTILIGAITFSGSVYAFAKLAGLVPGRPIRFKGLKFITNATYLLLAVGLIPFTLMAGHGDQMEAARAIFIGCSILSLVAGVFMVMPIGGGDMPVVISMLNSLSGIAAAASGFVIQNTLLVVTGCLVGVSGVILTLIMCKAMNRTIMQVFLGGFGADGPSTGDPAADAEGGELKPISVEDAYYLFEGARNVVFVPGYGMALAQAQHAVKELAQTLADNGAEVRFAIHPVAGRMPGHMNVLLAEADVSYDQLWEMDAINPQMPQVDLAVVVGANDVVNPAAAQDKSSPLYGMPIINVHLARTVICLKRGKGTGFSGLENKLFILPNTRMLYGDAKQTLNALVAQFKQAGN